ncbi:MAG TPA: polysaccharide deacetylase family protein [Alphaproteobacteria bacterium]|nr:polysaccharide deacetylase family protein [Alphaproteobacteria bacterium]
MKVSLTIDNGPCDAVTPAVLDVLADKGVYATFFVLGSQAERSGAPAILGRARAEGHLIGNHTFSHAMLGDYDFAAAREEIERTQRVLAPFAAERLFRPPAGGKLHAKLLSRPIYDYLCEAGFTIALWNSVPEDWINPEGWPETALAHARSQDWAVTVVHDIETGAMRHLARFIDMVRNEGGVFVRDLPAEVTPVVAGVELWPLIGHNFT